MCATISDSFKQMSNISKALNMTSINSNLIDVKSAASALRASSSAYYNISELKRSAAKNLQIPHMDEFKAIANNTYMNSASIAIQSAAMAAVAIPNLNGLTAANTSLSKSIASTLSPIDLNFSPKISAQTFGNALTTMRYFSTSNNHINLQWKNLINTGLSDQFINSLTDISKAAKLRESMGISESDLKYIQNAIYKAYEDNDNGVGKSNFSESANSNNHLQKEQDDSNALSNVNNLSQIISLHVVVSILIILISTGFFLDGTVRNKPNEIVVSALIDKAQSILDTTEKGLKK